MITTIDVVGVRMLHDKLGARAAGKLLTRCTRERPTHVAIEEIKRAGATLATRRGHASIWTALDTSGRTRIDGSRLSMRETWPDLPTSIVAAIVGQPITSVLGHPLLDDGMVVESLHVDEERSTAEMTLSGTARPLREVLDALRDGLRP
jgi:hypothetical protein